MLVQIGFYSYLVAAFGYLGLFLLLFFAPGNKKNSRHIRLAILASGIWALVIALSYQMGLSYFTVASAEITRNGAWLWCLITIMQPLRRSSKAALFRIVSHPGLLIGCFVLLSAPIMLPLLSPADAISQVDLPLIAWLIFALLGLMLVEQFYRNTHPDQRWAIKFFCLGLGALYVYDFFMYADGLLFKQLDSQLWSARGMINTLTLPLLAIAISRNPNWSVEMHLSRHVVFHTATLSSAGLYLIIMSLAGYGIRYYGGSWGTVLQITFLVGAGILLFILLFSAKIQASTRVFLSKHFFGYKYDYRDEWQKFTDQLSDTTLDIPERICSAICLLVQSKGGVIWGTNEQNKFQLIQAWNMPAPALTEAQLSAIGHYLSGSEWVIDIDEYRQSPDIYEALTLPDKVVDNTSAWLIVPLLFHTALIGFVLIRHSDIQPNINWEDRDLLKICGKQSAVLLAQYHANQALIQARQFEAFNRLSAYIVHDLKNILAQQSLIVANAEKHKHNPAFVEDVILTVRNSVNRMTRLMEQMRNGMRGSAPKPVELGSLLGRIAQHANQRHPRVTFFNHSSPCRIVADNEQLGNVFAHLIQNAQEATTETGWVKVSLYAFPSNQQARIDIEDCGCGMDEDFIRHRLFKPFDSTKGLAGMGIGVFESRELVRSLGGDIHVTSTPGKGSLFCVYLPLLDLAPSPSDQIQQ